MTIEAVFFDLGDTLSDLREGLADYTTRVQRRAGRVYDVLAVAGLSLPERTAFSESLAHATEARYVAAQAQLRSVTIYEVMREILREEGFPDDDALVTAAGDAYCLGVDAPLPLRAGALKILTALQARGYRLGVISNTIQPGPFMDATLTRNGLLSFFPVRIYSSEVGVPKPHPDIFRAALDAMRVRPERAAHVGDRMTADVAGAQTAGMRAILIEVAHRPELSDHIIPDARIRELPELPAALDALDGGAGEMRR
jgi:putative hydrolase of the HAD superfamily